MKTGDLKIIFGLQASLRHHKDKNKTMTTENRHMLNLFLDANSVFASSCIDHDYGKEIYKNSS